MFTICVGLPLLVVFELCQNMSTKRRLLSPHELNLRRATQPLGFVAILAWVLTLPGARRATDLSPVFHDPGAYWLPLTLFAVVLLYGFASVITGLTRCWGVRSDGMLPMRALIKCAFGIWGFVLVYQPLTNGFQLPGRGALIDLGNGIGASLVWGTVTLIAMWCATVGAARLVLLTIGGGSALRRIKRHIQGTQLVMRPVRQRPWWKFW